MLNRDLRSFLDRSDAVWAEFPAHGSPVQRRAVLSRAYENLPLPFPPGVNSSEEHLIASTGGTIRIRLFRPAGGTNLPCMIYLHGGAWIMGSPETHASLTANFAAATNHLLVSVDYALAPEYPFPTAVNQCADAVRYVFKEAETLGIDRHRIVIGGDSAGGNLAAAMTLLFKDDPDICFRAQLLIYPSVELELSRPAFVENAQGPLLTTAATLAAIEMYCPHPEDRNNPLASPYLAPDHTGLPPAFVAAAEHDPLRDDGIDYASKLRDAGVEVVFDPGTGLIHGYLWALQDCADCMTKFEAMCAWLVEKAAR